MTYPIPDWTADACTREADWLKTSGDGLPALQVAAGGPWGIVQAYWPGNRLNTQKTGIYVLRRAIDDDHPVAQRYRSQYLLVARLIWPLRAASPIAETEQAAFDAAIGLLLQRIRGPVGDKTHGGRFLSVGEDPGVVSASVVFEDPEVTILATKDLRATATYHADDHEYNG